MRRGRRRRRGTRQVLIIEQVAVIRRVSFHGERGRGFTFVGAAHPVQLQTCKKVELNGRRDVGTRSII